MRDLTPGNFDSPTFQLGGPVQYAFSPDTSELCFVSNHEPQPATSTNNDLWLLSLETPNAEPRNITAANLAYDGSPKYSPDGRYIGYRTQKQPDTNRISSASRSTIGAPARPPSSPKRSATG